MSKIIDISGKKFNNLLAIDRLTSDKSGKSIWRCMCDCGNYTAVSGVNLSNGSVKSCGCLKKNPANMTHNMSKSRIYNVWASMRGRCNRTTNPSYKNYGGRGIKVCKEWNDSFEHFRDWAFQNGYNDGLTIERIDNDGNYSPYNCRWATLKEQAQNKRWNMKIEYQGKTQNLKQWCDELKLNYKRTHNRLTKLGMTFEQAITMPVVEKKRNMEARKKYG